MNEREDRQQLVMDYQTIFKSPRGKAVLEDLEKKALNLKRSRFEDGYNVNQLIFEEGRRSVILYIQRMLEVRTDVERPTQAKG